jgi:hypothetical protein
MSSLLKEVVCVAGCIYLALHIAYALTSAADSIGRRRRQARRTAPTGRRCTVGRDATVRRESPIRS